MIDRCFFFFLVCLFCQIILQIENGCFRAIVEFPPKLSKKISFWRNVKPVQSQNEASSSKHLSGRLLKLDHLSRRWVASSCNISLTGLCLIETLARPRRTSWLRNVSSSPPTSRKQQIGSTKAAAAIWISVWLFYSVQRCILSARKSFINRLTTVNRFISAKLLFFFGVWTIKGAQTIY